jgi:hypothetical protein
MAFRMLYALEKCGMVEKVGENLINSVFGPGDKDAITRILRAGNR